MIPVLVSWNTFWARVMRSSAAIGKEEGVSGKTAGGGAATVGEVVAVAVSDTCNDEGTLFSVMN